MYTGTANIQAKGFPHVCQGVGEENSFALHWKEEPREPITLPAVSVLLLCMRDEAA
jgi:hypothetical protein